MYKAAPRDGVWATPPFMHNGSVPNLYEMFVPARERTKKFCYGREFDPVKVGLDTTCKPGTFVLDTELRGNSNAGHSFEDSPRGNGVIGPMLTRRTALGPRRIPEVDSRRAWTRNAVRRSVRAMRQNRLCRLLAKHNDRETEPGGGKPCRITSTDRGRSEIRRSTRRDLFLFQSPENPARTVFAADVFPSAGTSAVFTDAANHAIVARRVTVAGLGDAAKFQAGDREIRFNFRFDRLEAQPGGKPIQRGTCTLPDGQTLRFVVNDEKGATTPDGTFRVFAGLRSDPFLLAWLVARAEAFSESARARQRAVFPGRSSIPSACSIPRKVRCSASSPRRRRYRRPACFRRASSRRASIGSAARSRPTFA